MPRSIALVSSVAFALVLWLPMVQMAMPFAPVVGLDGVTAEVSPTVEPGFSAWCDGTLQEGWRERFERELGLRDWLVRLDNELRYRLFGATRRPVVCGQDGWLFEHQYLPFYCHAGADEAREVARSCDDLTRLQWALAEHGVTLVVAISPSKAALHPERLPGLQRRVAASIRSTLREEFLARAQRAGLHVLDYPSVFRGWQREAAAPLFPRGGVHWSNHAAARAASCLVDFTEQVGRVDLRNIDVVGARWSQVPIGADGDLARLANTLDAARFDDPTLVPELGLRDGDAGRPAALLMIGTSFCWQLGAALSQLGATRSVELYYYAKSAWRFVDGQRVAADAGAPQDLDALRRALLAVDAVVIECNESALPRLGAGAIAPALLAFGVEPGRPLTPEEIDEHTSR